jgi:hypothetical protein
MLFLFRFWVVIMLISLSVFISIYLSVSG